jgi:hypothetical protein
MYMFGMDIPLNAMIGVGLLLHVIEFLLVIAIMRKIKRLAGHGGVQ